MVALIAFRSVWIAGLAVALSATRDSVVDGARLHGAAPSPDGAWIAVVVERRVAPGENYTAFVDVNHEVEARSDIWLVSRDGQVRRNLTNGHANASGYFGPQWSPDGQRLAMQTIATHSRARLVVWDRATDRLDPISPAELSPDEEVFFPGAVTGGGADVHFQWLTDTTLVYVAAGHTIPAYAVGQELERTAEQGWADQARGDRPTASVLDANAGEGLQTAVDTSRIIVARVLSASIDTVATLAVSPGALVLGRTATIAVSPNGQWVAVVAAAGERVDSVSELFDQSRLASRVLIIASMQKRATPRVVPIDSGARSTGNGAYNSQLLDDRYAMPTWAPDGRDVVVAGWIVPVDGSPARRITTNGLAVHELQWASGRTPLARATRPDGRLDWYRLDIDGRTPPRNVTGHLRTAPSAIVESRGSGVGYYAADGALWALLPESTRSCKLTTPQVTVRAIAWPASRGGPNGNTPLATVRGPLSALVLVVGSSPSAPDTLSAAVVGPSCAEARLATIPTLKADWHHVDGIDSTGSAALIELRNTPRTYLIRSRGGSGVDTLFEASGSGPGLELSQTAVLSYLSDDGQPLTALLALPEGYVPGRRYPMIVTVYAGTMQSPSDRIVSAWAPHGYLELYPSMPVGDVTKPGDDYWELSKGVLPAIDRAIELGYADSARVGVWGHSYGGFSTYGLITQTHRFKAAVAEAGPVDFLSLYGAFRGDKRYSTGADPWLSDAYLFERGQAHLGVTPMANLWRYLRDSPIAYADRITTPLMIVQGDLDFVPMEQGEEMFSILQRLGKRVQFVRYWGEGHILFSPANIRDKAERELQWFDTYLACGKPPTAQACDAPERQATPYRVTDSIAVGDARGDFYAIDPIHRRLYGAGPMVVDIDKMVVAGSIADTSAGGGFALAPELGRGVVRTGMVFDLRTNAVLAHLAVSGDGYAYDSATGRVFLFADTTSAIDVRSGVLSGTIALGGSPESAVSDGRGTLYVNLQDKGAIAVIDAHGMRVRTTYPLPGCELPHALSIDRLHERLFVSCANKHVLVADATTGVTVAQIPVPGMSDQTAFDPGTQLLLAPNWGEDGHWREGGLTVIHEDTPDTYSVVETLRDPRVTSNKIAVDPTTHRAFLPQYDRETKRFRYVVVALDPRARDISP